MSNNRRPTLYMMLLVFAVGVGVAFFFTEYAVIPVLTEQKIQIIPPLGSEPQTVLGLTTYFTRAVDFAQTSNGTRFGVGGSYVLDRRVENKTVIVEKYQVPLRVGGRVYVEVYEVEGPTLDGKILKGKLLAATPDYTKSLYLVTAVSLIGLFGLTFLKRRSKIEATA